MKRLRKVAFTFLVMYALLTVAISLHSHPQGIDGVGLHCKLCQVSQICLEETGTSRITTVLPEAPFLESEEVLVSAVRLTESIPQRSPPLA